MSDIIRCMICFQVPIYPKECSECSQIICETCLQRYEKTKTRNQPVCMHCKSESTNFKEVHSKVLLDIIDRVVVGHRCSKTGPIESYSVQNLKRHVERSECSGYSLKCFCGHLDKFNLEDLKKHLKEDCEMVRLQCKYCHLDNNYPAGILDQDTMIHFNEHSFTREQFREHSCYKQSVKIDEKMQEIDAYCKIKMVLLQATKEVQEHGLRDTKNLKCLNKRCQQGWFNPGE